MDHFSDIEFVAFGSNHDPNFLRKTRGSTSKQKGMVIIVKKLTECDVGEDCVVEDITATPQMSRRLTELGLIRGTPITVLHRTRGGMSAYLLRSSVIALRAETAETIAVRKERSP